MLPLKAGEWGAERFPFVAFDESDGSFELECLVDHEELKVSLQLKGQPNTAKAFTFIPTANGPDRGVELHYSR